MRILRRAAVVAAIIISSLSLTPHLAAASTADDEQAFLRDINSLRASKGAGALKMNGDLVNVARAWAYKMAEANKISHNPNLAAQAPSGWTKLGENVGVGYDESSLHRAFVNSPGHYANLVDGKYNQVGIAVVSVNGRLWTVHMFMASNKFSSTPAAPSAPVAAAPQIADRYARALAAASPAVKNAQSLRAQTAIRGR